MEYDEFCEMVERACFTAWRSVFGRENKKVADVNSLVFTRDRKETLWTFSFGARLGKVWCQHQEDMRPLVYSVANIGPPGTYDPERDMSPEARAQEIAMKLLAGAKQKVDDCLVY